MDNYYKLFKFIYLRDVSHFKFILFLSILFIRDNLMRIKIIDNVFIKNYSSLL